MPGGLNTQPIRSIMKSISQSTCAKQAKLLYMFKYDTDEPKNEECYYC